MASERLQGKEQFHFQNCVLKISHCHPKMRLERAPQKMNFLVAKAVSKVYTLACSSKYPCTFQLSYPVSFSIKAI